MWHGSRPVLRRGTALLVASRERVAFATGSVLQAGLWSWKSNSAHA